ncbi:unnamed protein product [Adineta steineri]|uniref:Uncharacterized protein n=1 Tax=Adineta steineri TaxID=433720 RepID=A0A814XI40_9BILA|nr:unnamed protein product [Adineta steineri]CAF1215475.1 unnamed protein product [Adineta steineri]
MNINYVKNQKGLLHLSRLIILMICIIYINILSCGQNAFGGHANVNSTSDIMWVALGIDGFVFFSRIFEQDDGTSETSILIDAALGLIYFVAFVILLVSWIKCSDTQTLFCNGNYKCIVHILPTLAALTLTILYIYHDVRRSIRKLNSI